jgi:hypothetical protein
MQSLPSLLLGATLILIQVLHGVSQFYRQMLEQYFKITYEILPLHLSLIISHLTYITSETWLNELKNKLSHQHSIFTNGFFHDTLSTASSDI